MQEEFGYPALTTDVKERILSTNAASVYGVDLAEARAATPPDAWLDKARAELGHLDTRD